MGRFLHRAASLVFCLGLLFTWYTAEALCPGTTINETNICQDVNSTDVSALLTPILPGSIANYSCAGQADLFALTSDNISQLLNHMVTGSLSFNTPQLTLLFTKLNDSQLQLALESLNNQTTNTSSVPSKDVFLTAIWNAKLSNLTTFSSPGTAADWFQKRLRIFLSAVTSDILQCLQNMTLDCQSYQAIVQGLNSEFAQMTWKTQGTVYDSFVRTHLQAISTTSPGAACNTGVNSSLWLSANFGNFKMFATYENLVSLNNNFNGLDVLDLLTSLQLADMTVLSGALSSDSNITAIFNNLDNRNLADLAEFYTQFNMWNLSLVNITASGNMLNRTLMRLVREKSQLNTNDYADWFQHKLSILLPSITGSQLTQILSNVSCDSLHAVVSGVDKSYPAMSIAGRQEIYSALWSNLNQSKNASPAGSVCVPMNATNANRDWLLTNFRSFRASAKYADLQLLNPTFSGLDVLDLLTSLQLADMTVLSGAFSSDSNITAIFNNLDNRTLADLAGFYTQFNMWNLSLVNITASGAMLNRTLMRLVREKSQLNTTDFADWFQHKLTILLPSITGSQLTQILTNVSCDSLQAVVSGVDKAYPAMSIAGRQEIYSALWSNLNQSKNASPAGSVCVPMNATNANRDWLLTNFRSFRASAKYADLQLLNPTFSGLDVLDLLTSLQLADMTVLSGALSSDSNITAIFNNLDNRTLAELAGFYTQFNMWNLSLVNITASGAMLNRTLMRLVREKSQLNTTDYADWFQNKLPILLPSITGSQLTQILSNVLCDSLQAVVSGVDKAYSAMSMARRQEIYGALWSNLNQTKNASPAGSVCVPMNATNANRDWLLTNFRSFRASAKYADLQLLNPTFSGLDVLDLLTSLQLADMTVLSGALSSDSNITAIFNNLDNRTLADLAGFYTQFNMWNLSLVNITASGTMLNRTLMRLVHEKSQLNTTDYADWFQNKLPILLPSITGSQLTQILSNVSCDSLQAVVSGVDKAYSEMSMARRQEIYGALWSNLNQTKNASPAGSVCVPMNATNANRDWLLTNFRSFRASAKYADLQLLNPTFSGLNVLDLLTSLQLADMTVLSGALSSDSNITAIFNNLDNRTLADLAGFYTQFNMWNLSLVNITASGAMLNRTLMRLVHEKSQLNTTDYADWFQNKLSILLPSITGSQLTQILSNVSCDSLQAVVSGVDKAYSAMSMARRQEIYGALWSNLNQTKNASPAGSVCVPMNATNANRDWLLTNFRSFRASAKYADLQLLNPTFSGLNVLDLLTSLQLADMTVLSGALSSDSNITAIFNNLDNRTLADLAGFYTQFNMWNLSLVNITASGAMLNRTLMRLVHEKSQLNTTDYADWFQNKLPILLPSITGSQLTQILSNVSCDSLQAVVSGVDKAYSAMSMARRQEIYGALWSNLNQTKNASPAGSVCVPMNATNANRDWLLTNFRSFRASAKYADLQLLNPTFSGLDVLDLLTSLQLADMTVLSGALSSDSNIAAIFNNLDNRTLADLAGFYTEFNMWNLSLVNITASGAMLNRTLMRLVHEKSQLNTTDYADWFQNKLPILLPSITGSQLTQILSNVSCDSLQVVVSGVDKAYPAMSMARSQEIYSALWSNLNQTKNASSAGPVCAPMNATNVNRDWLLTNFRSFRASAKYADLQLLNPTFSGLDVLDLLTSLQLADMTVLSGAFSSDSNITAIFNNLDNRTLADLAGFYTQFNMWNLSLVNITASGTMLNRTLMRLVHEKSQLNTTDYADWFQNKLPILLPSITGSQLTQILSNVSCDSLQAVVSGVDKAYSAMSMARSQEIYGALWSNLNQTKNASPAGSVCVPVNVSNANRDWLLTNFRSFRASAKYADLQLLNPTFSGMDVLELLTVKQLAQLSATNGSLKTPSDVLSVMKFVSGPEAVLEYTTEFNNLPNIQLQGDIQYTLLDQVFRKANLTTASDTEFSTWIGSRLTNLLPALNSSLVPDLFAGVQSRQCAAIQNMTHALDNLIMNFTNITQQAVYIQILSVETNRSISCFSNVSSFSVYLKRTFLGFGTFMNLQDAFSIVPPGRISEVVNTIPAGDFAGLLSSSSFIGSGSVLTSLLQPYNNKRDFIEKFNNGTVLPTLSDQNKAAILAGVWPAVTANNNDSDLSTWLGARLKPYFRFINKDLLSSSATKSATCLSFRKIVQQLQQNITLFAGQEKDLYSSIYGYLSDGNVMPRCYDGNDTSWFAIYLGSFFQYCTVDDIRALTGNSSVLQDFAVNGQNLQLINRTQLQNGVGDLYASALFAKDPSFSVQRLPDQLLCYAPNALKNSLPPPDILSKVKTQCFNQNSSTAPNLQLAAALVENLTAITPDSVKSLGQLAVGLNTAQIKTMNSSDVIASLDSLSLVQGWDAGQAQGIIKQLQKGNFQINSTDNFKKLGSLVPGLPSTVISSMPESVALNLSRDPGFVATMEASPVYLQQAFVSRISASSPTVQDLLNNVPDGLAGEIPNSKISFTGAAGFDVKSISQKKWKKDQASGFFGTVLTRATGNYSGLSASVLQGFQCSSGSSLDAGSFKSLVGEMTSKAVALDGLQSSCLAKLGHAKGVTDYKVYPADMLLFYDMNNVDAATCQDFFSRASTANINNLAADRVQKAKLLERSASCVGKAGSAGLNSTQLSTLGSLVCLMDPPVIAQSDPQILENLKQCPVLSDGQQSAVLAVLKTGTSTYGSPSTWNIGTFNKLGPLAYCLDSSTVASVNTDVRKNVFKTAVGSYKARSAPPGQLKKLMKSLLTTATKSKRAADAGCTAGIITTSSIQAADFILTYSDAAQFDLCLDNATLLANLAALAALPLPDGHLAVLKVKLDKIFPQGIPEDSLKLIGAPLQRLYSNTEISKWNITSEDTLAILMAGDPAWNASQAKQILTHYLLVNAFTGKALTNTGGQYLCSLDASQIQNISADALKDTGSLIISSCTQDKKDIFYATAKSAFAYLLNTSAYYPSIQSYLGGAGAADLQALGNVSMNIQTFMGLKPTEVPLLTVSDVKLLLGVNVADLSAYQNDPLVQAWIQSRNQIDLDTLGLALTGGRFPTGCLLMPNVTEVDICHGVNSDGVIQSLPNIVATNIGPYACALASDLAAVTSDKILVLLNNMMNGTLNFNTTQLILLFRNLNGMQLGAALDTFNAQATNTSAIPSKAAFLTALWNSNLQNVASLNSTTFAQAWFQSRLRPFLSAVTPDLLQCLLTDNIGCSSYQATINGLSSEYQQMTPLIQNYTYTSYVKVYLQRISSATSGGPVCVPVNVSNENREWLLSNFRSFRASANYSDFQVLKPTFSGLDALDLLNSLQLADMTVLSGALSSDSNITAIFNNFDNRTLADLAAFYTQFNMRNPSLVNTTASGTMLNRTLMRLVREKSQLNTTDYADWFQNKLPILLPSITGSELTQILSGVPCDSLQAVVSGVDIAYPAMIMPRRQEIYSAIWSNLNQTKNASSAGPVCAPMNATNASRDWLLTNFRSFRASAKYADLQLLNPTFSGMDVLDLLTVQQLAQLSATKGSLTTPSDALKVMNLVSGPRALVEYITEFNSQPNIQLQGDIRYTLLDQVLGKANLTTANDTEFSTWIGSRLTILLPALNSSLVPGLFAGVLSRPCSAIQNMTHALDNLITNFTNITQQAVYTQILSVEKGRSLSCFSNASSFSVYLRGAFLGFGTFLNLQDAFSIVPPGRISEVVNTIPAGDFADALSSSAFIGNGSLLTSLLQAYNNKRDFIEHLNNGTVLPTLSDQTKAAILAGVWPAVTENNNDSDLSTWLGVRLQPYLRLINKDLLSSSATKSATCLSFRKIVQQLQQNITLFAGQESDLYSSIYGYLSGGTAQPRCYNSTETSWFNNYFGSFIKYLTLDDMLKLTVNETVLKNLALDPKNLDLFGNSDLQDGVGSKYTAAIFAAKPDFNITSLPDKLLCFAQGSNAFKTLTAEKILDLIKKIQNVCATSSSTAPSSSDIQLAASLVENPQTIDSSVVALLKQQAIGLNSGQIKNMNASDVINSLGTLGEVQGWDAGQAQSIIKKLHDGNFKFNSEDNLKQLGSLVIGLSSSDIKGIQADVARSLSANTTFVNNLKTAPNYVQQAFVGTLAANSPTTKDLLDTVPDGLAAAIPNSQLKFASNISEITNITLISKKAWSKQQASVFFGNVFKSTTDYTQLSPSVLQGFQCSAGSSLTPGNFGSFIRVMKTKGVSLDAAQSSCLVKLGNASPGNITDYPPTVLLFVNSNNITCEQLKLASTADISTLAGDSIRTNNLLAKLNSCFVTNGAVPKDTIGSLGNLVCLLDPSVITKSDPQIIQNLKQCPQLSDDQQSAMRSVLSSGSTSYGAPSTWNLQTFKEMGQLSYFLNSSIIKSVNGDIGREFFKTTVANFKTKGGSKAQVKSFVSSFISSNRNARGAGCTVGNITASTIQDPAFLLTYQDVTQFDLCLDKDVLLANLAPLASQPLPAEYLQKMKAKLDQIYPQGIPEDSLKLMGAPLLSLYSSAEISKWNITSEDTLAILMNPSDPLWTPSQAKQILTNDLLVNAFTGKALTNTGGQYLCSLDASQIQTISADALKDTGSLIISSCTQDKKDIFYATAKSAFAYLLNTFAYYPSIQSYLGGAGAADLRALGNVSMNIQTFMGLKPTEVPLLTVSDVKLLLGVNVADLSAYQNDPLVQAWIQSRNQIDLDTLGLALTGGRFPTGCLLMPNVTEVDICQGVNSDGVIQSLPNIVATNIGPYACALASDLAAVTSDKILVLLNNMMNGTLNFNTTQLILLFRNLNGMQLGAALDTFNAQATNTSAIPSKAAFLTALWNTNLQNVASLNSTTFAQAWFQSRLRPFLSAVTPDLLQCLLTDNIGCSSYQATINGLSSEYQQMTPLIQNYTYTSYVKVYLQRISSATSGGPVCVPVNVSNENRVWLLSNFGSFRASANYSDFQVLKPTFSGLDALDLLNSLQLADMTVLSGALSSDSNITAIFNNFDNRTLADLAAFYTQFNMRNLSLVNITASGTMLNRTLMRLVREKSQLNTTDYADWFQNKLPILLPSITGSELTQILSGVPCDSLQAVVSGVDKAYPAMSMPRRQEIYSAIWSNLNQTKNASSAGPVCAPMNATNASRDWLLTNFRSFRASAKYADLQLLNPTFSGMDVLDLLTVQQHAQLSATKGSLTTQSDALKVMNLVSGPQALVEYITEFNSQPNIQLQGDIRYTLLDQVLGKANLITANDTEFSTWIGSRLTILLPALNSSLVPGLFAGVQSRQCSAIQNMTHALDNLITNFTNITQQAVYTQILSVEKGRSLSCFSNASSFSVYLRGAFLGFGTFLNLQDAFSIVPPGRISEVVNTIPAGDFADALSSSAFIGNGSLLTSLLQPYNKKRDFIEKFNNGTVLPTLSDQTKAAILAGVWPAVTENNNDSDLSTWLGVRLQPYLRLINKDLLSSSATKSATCLSFRKIVQQLQQNITLFAGQESDLYSSIYGYLSGGTAQPRCYNSTETSWFHNYFGSFIKYLTLDDMLKLTVNENVLKNLALDPKNLDLFGNSDLQDGVGSKYTAAIFAAKPDFNITSLPDKLLCFAQGSNAFKTLTAEKILDLINKIQNVCATSSSTAPSSSDIQLAASLVENLQTIDSSVVALLKQQAIGLNSGQIKNMNASDVINSLGTLGAVQGWDAGQAQSIIKKLHDGNFKFNSEDNLKQLGSLVIGLSSSDIKGIQADVARSLSANTTFVNNLKTAPNYVQQAFVGTLAANSPTTKDLLDTVPDGLAAAIPNSQLKFASNISEITNITLISKKAWSKQQASVFFGNVFKSTTNYTQLSPSVLQGFQCSAGSSLTPGNFGSFISVMKTEGVSLDAAQSSCLAKLGNASPGITTDYPSTVLLFVNNNITCEELKLASTADISTLAGDSIRTNNLLAKLNSCFVTNGAVPRDTISSLGNLVCLLDPSVITKSDPQIIQNLKQCPQLSDDQQSAMRSVLSSGSTSYGAPSTWNLKTLKDMGQLSYYLNTSIIKSVNGEIGREFFKTTVANLKTKGGPKAQVKSFVSSFISSNRQARGAGCTVGNITASTIQDAAFLLTYQDVTQFDLCLDKDVLQANLAPLANQPLPEEYLQKLKAKLDQIYPQGIPEDSLKLMGAPLQRLYNSTEISKWNITSEDTLAILMNPSDPLWTPSQASQILTSYLQANELSGTALQNIGGGYLCTLSKSQIKNISANALKDAGSLNVTTCSPESKHELYSTAKSAFASLKDMSYYTSIEPYLGGASAEDLRNLGGVSMSIQTFIGLNSNATALLSPTDVKTMLGVNYKDLKTYENTTEVQAWIKSQYQSELDLLGIGLTGGRAPALTTARPALTTARPARPTPVGYVVVPYAPASGVEAPSFGILRVWIFTAGFLILRHIL
ncbi:uncharacterized protein [Ambystoma mexicanum]|uniref:uncharacterized protein isoform X3 n=1 Tax=Ambystoma mexicanum TaxID=8296 RepID=UPI0037E7024C